MPTAAVPEYLLKNDLRNVSPGLRFSIYLPIWTNRIDQEADVKTRADAKSREGDEVKALLSRGMDYAIDQLKQRTNKRLPSLWDKNDFASKNAWGQITRLFDADKATIKALLARQQIAFNTVGQSESNLSLSATAISPFTTGLGNEHPLENGFAFLNPYGMPYLPGSGVKGVLRRAATELASGDWGETHCWNALAIDTLFGKEDSEEPQRGALSFWDVIPQIKGDSLAVEIMTPHQSHYYQEKKENKSGDSISPHDSGSLTPISFLTVPAGSEFHFFVTCDIGYLEHICPALAENSQWKTVLNAVFEHAFTWLGFGAKTAVGYGAMQSEAQLEKIQLEAEARQAREKLDKQQAQEKRDAESAVAWAGARVKYMANGALLVRGKDGKEVSAITPKGKELLDTLPADIKSKITSDYFKNPKINAFVADGKTIVRIEPDESK